MAKAYQYDADGYYAGEIEDYGGPLPNNAARTAPKIEEGFIPRWNGKLWEQVENNKGREGYVNGEAFTVKEYGPLPEGWSATLPPPSLNEMKDKARAALREKRKAVEYGGFTLDGQHWDSAEKDELRLNSVMRIFDGGMTQYEGWKIAEGVYITLTPELVQRAAMALMQHYSKAFSVEEAKLEEVNALESAEAVETWLETELNKGW